MVRNFPREKPSPYSAQYLEILVAHPPSAGSGGPLCAHSRTPAFRFHANQGALQQPSKTSPKCGDWHLVHVYLHYSAIFVPLSEFWGPSAIRRVAFGTSGVRPCSKPGPVTVPFGVESPGLPVAK